MAKKKHVVEPEITDPDREHEIEVPADPEDPVLDPKEPDFVPDEDPFENPSPYEIPPPGERP
jgi:hypothetical protein